MAESDSPRSVEELIEQDKPKNGQMEIGKDKKAHPISRCFGCENERRLKKAPEGRIVTSPAIGFCRVEGFLRPMCRMHKTDPVISFGDVWEEWCIQSVQDA